MSELRHVLRKEVVEPALIESRKTTLAADIIKKNKNTYTIEFTNVDGEKETKKGIKARQYSNSSTTEYGEGERVLVEYENKEYEIVAKYVQDQDALRQTMAVPNDVYSNLYPTGGSIT